MATEHEVAIGVVVFDAVGGAGLHQRFFGPKIRAGLETEIEYERRGPNWASRPTTTERSG